MKLFYDLHIHSALSPCGDEDMTPNNIVNMALIKGLSAIALADHNSCGNVRSLMKVAEDRLLIIPAMEVTTSEEVHVLCLFPTIEQAEDMGKLVYTHLPDIKNRPDIFGHQYYMNEKDEITGEEERLLVSATDLSIYEVEERMRGCGGLMIPAHIDRSSYSLLANLGFMPPDLPVTTVEITARHVEAMQEEYAAYHIITDSDAHYLEDMAEAERSLDILDKKTDEVIKFLSKK